MRVHLTDRFCGTARHGTYFDEQVTGLTLRVLEDVKSWSFAYTRPSGQRTQFRLGGYPATSLAAARAIALEARDLLDQGQDPQAAFGARKAGAMTVADLVAVYLAHPDKTKLRTHAELSRRFKKNVLPIIGGIGIGQLHRRDVRRCIDAVLGRGSEIEAMRCFEDVRALLRWAVARGDLESNPVEAMRKPAGSKPRTRTLSPDEIRALWNGLPKALARSKACQRIIQLCLVTGQRVGEVAGMEVAELEPTPLEMKVSKGELTVRATKQWKIPGRRTKNGYEHTVPLSDLAIEIITAAIADAGKSPTVFPAGDRSLSAQAVARTILRAQGRFGLASWSAHDLRRTALNSMAALGVAPHILGHVANHRSVTRATVTTQHYVIHRYEAEVRAALELWADRLAAIVSGEPMAKVIPIGGTR